MKETTLTFITISIAILALNSCGRKEFQTDYGKPEAQFYAKDVSTKGKPFIGKKVTVRGIVEKVDTLEPDSAWIQLSEGIRCNFGDLHVMAESCKVGDEAYVDGLLKNCDEGKVLIDPAILRDPKATFEPME